MLLLPNNLFYPATAN